MVRLRGHFDGNRVVLDEPAPEELKPNTPVEILVLDAREQALAEMQAFLKDLWSQPLPTGVQPAGRRWTREELYERGRHDLP
jgi:hypothetical protein